MLRRLAAVAACVVLLAAVPTGSVYVTTLPSGAGVWIDGTYVGRSPAVIDALTAGPHTVGLTKAGWTSQQLAVTIAANRTTASSTRLIARGHGGALAGSIALHGALPGAAYLDGIRAVTARDGTIPAAAGTHELRVRTQRGPATRLVTVWPQTQTEVVLVPDIAARRAGVVMAPAEDYVSKSAVRIEGDKVLIRSGGHEVVGRIGATRFRVDGKSNDYGEAPTMIGSRLYLPLDLLMTLSAGPR